MKVLKICIGTWENASRDKRELSVCKELGADVQVIAKGEINGKKETVDGFQVIRLSSRILGNKAPVALNRAASIFSWASYIRKMEDIDVISGHDFIALLIGYFSNFRKKNKAKLVYDSHEFELGRNTRRSKFVGMFVCWLERFLMNRCVFSMMVNDSIADEVQRIHRLEQRPIVVRNVTQYWQLDQVCIERTRLALMEKMNLSGNEFLVMYHGAVANARGIEEMLQAVARVPNTAAVVLGDGDHNYCQTLHHLCEKLAISDRVIFHQAVPAEILWKYVAAADVGMVTVQPLFKSYYFMLPNKFFENIQALTPVIVSDFPEVGRLVDKYQIGLKVDPADVDETVAAIKKMMENKEFYVACKRNLKHAKEELCWENEKEILKAAYGEILK